MAKQAIQTKDAPAAIGTYSQAIRAGNTIYLSGQIPLDPKSMQLVYPGIKYEDPRDNSIGCAKRYQTPEEAEEALARLHGILEHAADEQFAPSPEADCRWCHMKPLCPRWPEGKEVPR